ncbi:PREDICTED: uncharacterized protein LOC108505771 isoform X4 [Lepidothrix coronata]|uniref:Uncharacterized protein LOC108505771 isoform X4 n=1 Tax=Lepidothrix coronata TaxID=321398 RepID=A0A6J0INN7_9PASS|nr:PREDICTED: uncharacterized protein LOC108505771 isoform X4 [Lepidothrix coronata]
MWNCCTLLLEFLGSNAAKFQLLPCLWDSLEKGKGSGACSAALGQPFLSLCNKWINLLFIEKKRTFFSPFFLFFFFLLICTLWAFCGPCWHSQVGFVWRQAGCWNSRGVLCQIHGLCSIPRVVLCGSNLCWCSQGGSVQIQPLLEFQGGFVWIQPLCWNSRMILCQTHGLCWNSRMILCQICGLCWNSRVVLCGSNLCAGIPGWFCASSMVCAPFQSGFVWIPPLCWNSKVVLCSSMVCAPFPEWISMDPPSVLEFQGGFVWIPPLCWNSRLVLCRSSCSSGQCQALPYFSRGESLFPRALPGPH